MILCFIGPSGCGKDTQVNLLAKNHEVENISTGELLRDLYNKGDKYGVEAAKYWQRGEWAPDEIIMKIVKKKLKSIDRTKLVILNGFPRTIEQAEEYNKSVSSDLKIDNVVYFALDNESAINRLSKRRICPRCKRIYHLLYSPSKLVSKCEDCRVELYQRKDDEPEIIMQRLNFFNETTKPILKYYERKSKLIIIDASPDVETIHMDLIKRLNLNVQ